MVPLRQKFTIERVISRYCPTALLPRFPPSSLMQNLAVGLPNGQCPGFVMLICNVSLAEPGIPADRVLYVVVNSST